MKYVLLSTLASLFLFASISVAEFTLPSAPNGYVLDEANVLSTETEARLEADLALLEQSNSTQMVVVTVSSLQGYEPEQFALTLGREWGVGQEEFNNGLVFLVAPTERMVRIEVGYGLEGAITDAQSFEIINQIALPYFRESNYDQGVLESMDVLEKLARGESYDLSKLDTSAPHGLVFSVIAYGLLFLWGVLKWFSQSKAWWMGGVIGGIAGVLLFTTLTGALLTALIGLILDYIVSTFFFGKFGHHSGHGGHSGGSSGGGSFGGFGGGSFGGGGAGGRW